MSLVQRRVWVALGLLRGLDRLVAFLAGERALVGDDHAHGLGELFIALVAEEVERFIGWLALNRWRGVRGANGTRPTQGAGRARPHCPSVASS